MRFLIHAKAAVVRAAFFVFEDRLTGLTGWGKENA
jgi:hypothetical protein